MSHYIGLISGTSMDGVDAALVSFNDDRPTLLESLTHPYPPDIKRALQSAISPGARLTVADVGALHVNIGVTFSAAALALMENCALSSNNVVAIGSHGQTIYHSPASTPPFTLQIGDGATIAHRTGIQTVTDFRSADVAAGGQGAPLVPPFHAECFSGDQRDVVVVNIGGISNITVLTGNPDKPAWGFDTGPGNCLLDYWCTRHLNKAFDDGGGWAKTGEVIEPLLANMLTDDFVGHAPPKSTGREYYNEQWIDAILAESSATPNPADLQATLLEFTVRSIAEGIRQSECQAKQLIVCGGGALNDFLMQRLQDVLSDMRVQSSSAYDIDPTMVEAAAFAWLAKQRIEGRRTLLNNGGDPNGSVLGALYGAPA